MRVKVDSQNLPAMIQRTIGNKPAEDALSRGFFNDTPLAPTQNIRDFDIRTADQLAQQVGDLIERTGATKMAYFGWGPHGADNAMAALGNVAETHNAIEHEALHINDGHVRTMTIGIDEQWTKPLPLTEPPVEAILETPLPHSDRDNLVDAYKPLATPGFGHLSLEEKQTYEGLPPSMRGEITNRLLDRLIEAEPDKIGHIQANLAYLISSDTEVRDFAIISGLQEPNKAQALIDLYRAAPEEMHGPLGVAASIGAFRSPGGAVAAAAILHQAKASPQGRGTGERLHVLASHLVDTGLNPGPVLKALETTDRTEDLAKADKEWQAARTSQRVTSRLPGLNDPINLNHKPPTNRPGSKPLLPPTGNAHKPTL